MKPNPPIVQHHTDMRRPAMWNYIPAAVHPYLELARLDRPIGIWLLLFPCWWGLELAGSATNRVYTLFALGAIIMRGAGCTLNDIIDRHIDAGVERTKGRPLPSGRIGLPHAILFLIFELALAFPILAQFPMHTIKLGLASLILVAVYPFMKRITLWPQAVLGLVFNWGILLAWMTVVGHLGVAAWVLYAAGFFWTLGYDTIYAHQDIKDDIRMDVGSTARRFSSGKGAVVFFYSLFFLALLLAGALQHQGTKFYGICGAAILITAFMLIRWRQNNPADCLERFKDNRWLGLVVFAAIVYGTRG